MKKSNAATSIIRVALVDSDPLRFVGFRALLESESDLEMISSSPEEIAQQTKIDLLLLVERRDKNLTDMLSKLKATHPDLPIIVVGHRVDDESILNAVVAGAKGYVFEGASSHEFAQAFRVVNQGSVWAPRRVLSMFIERALTTKRVQHGLSQVISDREKQVLEMLVAGLSNKEIGEPLGIEERTVKAHIAKMMRKVGVQNRIALSVHAITHSLVSSRVQ